MRHLPGGRAAAASILLVAIAGAACDDPEITAEAEEALSLEVRGGLDPDPVAGPAEIDMTAGRATQVPVGFVWTGSRAVDGAHTFRVRACAPPAPAAATATRAC